MAISESDFKNAETKVKVLRALVALLDEKPFDKITIADICEKATVAKSTFYRNFEDKYGVVEWYSQQLLSQSVFRVGVSFSWEEGYTLFLRQLKRDGDFFNAAVRSVSSRSLRRGNKVTACQDLTERLKLRVGGRIDRLLELQCKYFAEVMVDISCDWIERGFDDSPEFVAKLIVAFAPKELHDALQEPSLEDPWFAGFDSLIRGV